ncbi:MAG: hypothetical protein Q8Q02_13920 [Nocardioides sp.]|nr:hypothetical protein [Nocardioides sp.]
MGAIVPLATSGSGSGAFDIRLGSANAHLVVDVVGYFASGSTAGTFHPLQGRAFDTRVPPATAIPAGQSLKVPMGGVAGLPEADLAATQVNIAVVNTASTSGLIKVWADGTPEPGTAALNFTSSSTTSNSVTTAIDASGAIRIKNSSSSPIDVVVDVEGWYAMGDFDYFADVTEFEDGSRFIKRRDTGAERVQPADDGSGGTALRYLNEGYTQGEETVNVWGQVRSNPTLFSPADYDGDGVIDPPADNDDWIPDGTVDTGQIPVPQPATTPRGFKLYGGDESNVTPYGYVYTSDKIYVGLLKCKSSGHCVGYARVRIQMKETLNGGDSHYWAIRANTWWVYGPSYDADATYWCGVNIPNGTDFTCKTGDETASSSAVAQVIATASQGNGKTTFNKSFGTYYYRYAKFPMIRFDVDWICICGVGSEYRNFRGWDIKEYNDVRKMAPESGTGN